MNEFLVTRHVRFKKIFILELLKEVFLFKTWLWRFPHVLACPANKHTNKNLASPTSKKWSRTECILIIGTFHKITSNKLLSWFLLHLVTLWKEVCVLWCTYGGQRRACRISSSLTPESPRDHQVCHWVPFPTEPSYQSQ